MIHRHHAPDNFVRIFKEVLNNDTLSWQAKGLHSYLMGLPPDWKIYLEDLKNRSTNGRDSTANALNELIEAGYVVKTLLTDPGTKRFAGYNYDVFDRLEDARSFLPVEEKAVSGKPDFGKADTNKGLNEVKIEEEKINTEPTPKPKKPTRHRPGDTPQLALPLDMNSPMTPESLLHLWNSFEDGKHKPQQLTKERTTQINKIIQGLSPTNDEAEYVVENYRLWSTTQGQDYDSLSNATRYDKFEKRLIDYREGRGKKRLGKVLSSQKDSVDLHSDQPICF